MGYCFSKCNNKIFTLHMPTLTSRHLKKVVSGIQKNHVEYFTVGIHRNHEYERFTQSIKGSLIYSAGVTQIIMTASFYFCCPKIKIQ